MKLLLVDDHALFRAGLRMLLSTIDSGIVAIECATVGEAIAQVQAHSDIQLCLLDLNLKSDAGLLVLHRFRQAAPDIAVVVVSGTEDMHTVRACIDAGAMSYIPKSVCPEVLTEAVRQVLAGAVFLPDGVLDDVDDDEPARPSLTPRQRDVLGGLCRGLPTKSISRELSLSEHTVKEHIAAIFRILEVRNRTEAVIKASRRGL